MSRKKLDTQVKPQRYRPGKHHLQFACDWAVFSEGGHTSLCYCTDKARATLIAMAMNRFVKTDDFRKWMERRENSRLKVESITY